MEEDLQRVINELSNLNAVNSESNLLNMASFQTKAADSEHIPYFDRSPHNLLKFITVCSQVHGIVCKSDNTFKDFNEQILLSKILAGLTDEADCKNC